MFIPTEELSRSRRDSNFHETALSGLGQTRLSRARMHVRTRSTLGLARRLHFPGRTKCIGKCGSHAVSRPSRTFVHRLFLPLSLCPAPICLSSAFSPRRLDACTHALKDQPLFRVLLTPLPLPSPSHRFVKLGGNARMQPRAPRSDRE